MKIIAPFRGEFGIKIYAHVPAVYAIQEPYVACIERGEGALYPGAESWEVVPRRDDDTRARNDYKRDGERQFQTDLDARLRKKYPGAEIVRFRRAADVPRERFIPRPHEPQDVGDVDVVIAPRWRYYGHNKNWPHWGWLAERLAAEGANVFIAGAPDSSFPIDPSVGARSWDYDRFLDATLEAMHSADVVVATDAGLAHLAVLAGRPLIMITHADGLVAPGPNTDEHGNITEPEFWKVRMYRYTEGNHTGSPLDILHHAWFDPLKVLTETLRRLQ